MLLLSLLPLLLLCLSSQSMALENVQFESSTFSEGLDTLAGRQLQATFLSSEVKAEQDVAAEYMKIASNPRTFDWASMHAAKGNTGVYFASLDSKPDKYDFHNVVALHPDLTEDPTLTEAEFEELLMSLLSVAAATGRVAAWPAVPCNLSWIFGPSAHGPPFPTTLPSTDKWIAHIDASVPVEPKMMCTWTRPMNRKCLSTGLGMLPLEFDHYRDHYRLFRPQDPSPEKILLFSGTAKPGVPLTKQATIEVSWDELQAKLDDMKFLPGAGTRDPNDRPWILKLFTVYIGQPMKVQTMQDVHANERSKLLQVSCISATGS